MNLGRIWQFSHRNKETNFFKIVHCLMNNSTSKRKTNHENWMNNLEPTESSTSSKPSSKRRASINERGIHLNAINHFLISSRSTSSRITHLWFSNFVNCLCNLQFAVCSRKLGQFLVANAQKTEMNRAHERAAEWIAKTETFFYCLFTRPCEL